MSLFHRLFAPFVVAFVLMGVAHMTFSPVHRVAEVEDEESSERHSGVEEASFHSNGGRRRSLRRTAFCVPATLPGRPSASQFPALLPRVRTGELAGRNGHGGPLRT